jgi:DNA replication protein DnaC
MEKKEYTAEGLALFREELERESNESQPEYKMLTYEEIQQINLVNKPKKIDMTWEDFFALPNEKQFELKGRRNEWTFVGRMSGDEDVSWTRELENQIMLGATVCPICHGETRYLALYKCDLTGAYKKDLTACPCRQMKHKLTVLSQPWAIPSKYLWVDLETLKPDLRSTLSIARQQQEIDFLREHPDDGYLFCGKPGTSKTTFACALVRHAYERHWDYLYSCCHAPLRLSWMWIWRVSFDGLIAQYQSRIDDKDGPEPDVTPKRIKEEKAKGMRPVLCLEELDKIKLTQHRANKLFDLIDTLYNASGQLIVTTNLSYPQFVAALTKTNDLEINTAGGAVIRRLEELCHIRDFYKGESK